MSKIVIGIDVGGSTTKIVGFEGEHMITPTFVKAGDPIASAYGAFGKFTAENKIKLSDIEKIMMTGVGSTYIENDLYGIPAIHKVEFDCVGLGGLYLSKLDDAIIGSLGTGTAMVHAKNDGTTEYLGGTGVGGGTLIGLSKKMLGVSNVENLVELAEGGDLGNVDLRISDISSKEMHPGLPDYMTAANFGKLSDVAHRADVALGVINLVFESVGVLAVFSARRFGIRDIVLTGNLTTIPQSRKIFDTLNMMFDVNIVVPENAQYGTVIGAALSGIEK